MLTKVMHIGIMAAKGLRDGKGKKGRGREERGSALWIRTRVPNRKAVQGNSEQTRKDAFPQRHSTTQAAHHS